MITKLPLWILIGGAVLAFNAACVNIIALSGFTHLSVSHVTGNVSLFSAAIAQFEWSKMFFIGASLLSFLTGSILSGVIIGQRSLKLGRRYGIALFLEAGLLFCSFLLFFEHVYWGQLLAAMACGLQNSMVATYSGAVIRTTHLTGLTSDMGAAIGNWLAGRPINRMMLGFQAMIWYSFCGGGVVGAYSYFKLGYKAMLIPVGIVFTAALFYQIALSKLPEKRKV
ncbi:YoaK family protein [Psychrobacter sp.]|uniref:YoaK family protein n=1 Tax=Psychrobacter sp. TaxID=56811 RepID=UPI0025D6EE91|nr:YoaK family protein [Psychrobacter sp.]